MTTRTLLATGPYETPQCGVLTIQPEQILCGSSEIDDFDRVGDDWV